MEKCAFCETITELYYNGVPVCLECEAKRYLKETLPPADKAKPPAGDKKSRS